MSTADTDQSDHLGLPPRPLENRMRRRAMERLALILDRTTPYIMAWDREDALEREVRELAGAATDLLNELRREERSK